MFGVLTQWTGLLVSIMHNYRDLTHVLLVDTEAVDAFTVDLSGENNWWCPPPVLTPRVLRRAEACRARGTMLVPAWVSAPFWPMLCCDGIHWSDFIVDILSLPLILNMFHPGKSGSVLFNGAFPNTAVLALRLACCQPEMLTRLQPGGPCVCWPVGLLSTRDVD